MMNFKHGDDFLRCKCARAEQATDIMSSMQCSPFLSVWPTSAPEIAALRSLLPIPFCYFIAPATALKTGGGKEGSAALERGAASSHELSLYCFCFLVAQLNFWKPTVVLLWENCHSDRQPVFTVSLWRRCVHFSVVRAEMWVSIWPLPAAFTVFCSDGTPVVRLRCSSAVFIFMLTLRTGSCWNFHVKAFGRDFQTSLEEQIWSWSWSL